MTPGRWLKLIGDVLHLLSAMLDDDDDEEDEDVDDGNTQDQSR